MSSKEEDKNTETVRNSTDTDRLPPKKRFKFSVEDESSCCGEREKIINAGLHPVPLGRQVVHFIPVDLPGGDGGADQEEQQEQQQGQVMSGMRISSLVSAVWPLVRT